MQAHYTYHRQKIDSRHFNKIQLCSTHTGSQPPVDVEAGGGVGSALRLPALTRVGRGLGAGPTSTGLPSGQWWSVGVVKGGRERCRPIGTSTSGKGSA